MSLGTGASLRLLMDQLYALEQTAATAMAAQNAPDTRAVRTYRWRPRQIELPAIYNWINEAPFEQRDQQRWVDRTRILALVAIRHTDVSEEMATLERYIDAFRETMDSELHTYGPLAGTAWLAKRTGFRMVRDTFNDINVLAAEFTIEAELDRNINPAA